MHSSNTSADISRILLIDDHPAIHEDFRVILCPTQPSTTSCAFEVESALQGEEGLEKVVAALAEERPFAMAFVDVRMPPGWDGVETIARIWEKDAAIQVVICTAYADYSWQDIVRKLGNSDRLVILKKPFGSIEVLQLAQAMTAKWRGERERALSLQEDSAERVSKAFDACPLPMAILRLHDHGCVEMNRAFLSATGYAREEVLDRSLWESGLSIDARVRLEAMGQLAHGQPVRHRECHVTPKDGIRRDARLWIEPFDLPTGRHLIAIVHDVADQVTVEVPVKPDAILEAIAPVVPIPRRETPPSADAENDEVVLLVEDDDDLRFTAREALEEAGYFILEAADGHQAIKAWREFPGRIDLLLTDMVMPGGLSGNDVAECFKLDRPDSKVLFSSGYNVDLFGSDINLREGLNYLPKPYFAKQLIDAVARVIEDCAEAPAS